MRSRTRFDGATGRSSRSRCRAHVARLAELPLREFVQVAVDLHPVRGGQVPTLDARRYNPFHLLYADRDDAFVTWFDGSAAHQSRSPASLRTEMSFM